MKSPDFLRFSWAAETLPAPSAGLVGAYSLRPAVRSDKAQVDQVISANFLSDPWWHPLARSLLPDLRAAVERIFQRRNGCCLVATHGNHVIAASLLDDAANARHHLVSGPCVLPEYRNRGFGSLLLKESLATLAQAGIGEIVGLTCEGSFAAKFIYPKYGGRTVSTPAALVASRLNA